VADGFDDDLGAVAAGKVADLLDAVVAAFGDDMGGSEFTAEVGAGGMPSHEDDLLGSELPCGQDGQEADGAVTDDGDRGSGADAGLDSCVVAGAVDIRQGEQGRDERRILLDGVATRVPSASGTRMASA